MRPFALALLAFAACSTAPKTMDVDGDEPIQQAKPKAEAGPSQIKLDGLIVDVRWGDGDTFSFYQFGKKKKARLAGFNTLESYGPVHRWGDWTAKELYGLAMKAGEVASARGWTCTKKPGGGGYGRLLVDCPVLKSELIAQGLAHAFSMKGPADEATMAIQLKSIETKQGMWAKGVPEGLITSLHSVDEKPGRSEAYNRVVNPRTGEAPGISHHQKYSVCQEVCVQGSCMTYVPYPQRYGKKRPDCLR